MRVLVADLFRLVRLANEALTQVRQRVMREGRRGRKTELPGSTGPGC